MPRASWLALLLACTSTDPHDEQPAPVAASAPVAAPIAAPVAAVDGRVTGPTRWSLSSVFAGCKVSTASALGDDFPRPAWQPCKRGDCRHITFEPAKEESLHFFGGETAGAPMVAMSWERDAHTVLVLRPLDGPAALAFKIEGPRKTCDVDDVRFTADTAGVVLEGRGARALFVGPLHEDPAWVAPFLPLEDSRGLLLQGPRITLLAGTAILRTGPDDRTLAPLLAARGGRKIAWISGVGDAVLFGSGERGDDVQIVRPGRAPRRLIEIGKDQQVGPVVADGDRLYWAVGDIEGPLPEYLRDITTGWDYADTYLWTATLPADDAPLVARRVAELHNFGEYSIPALHARHGRVAYTTQGGKDRMMSSDIHLLDASTGESLYPGLPNSIHIRSVVLLTEHELVVSQQSTMHNRVDGLVRFSLEHVR